MLRVCGEDRRVARQSSQVDDWRIAFFAQRISARVGDENVK